MSGKVLWRLSPVLMLLLAAGFWIADVQDDGPYIARNLAPLALLLVLSWLVLWRGRGDWVAHGWAWPLGLAGFAIPALGLSLYLHYAWSVNLNGMFDEATAPLQLFRFLPLYTTGAGCIGFAIGWIVGKRV